MNFKYPCVCYVHRMKDSYSVQKVDESIGTPGTRTFTQKFSVLVAYFGLNVLLYSSIKRHHDLSLIRAAERGILKFRGRFPTAAWLI